MPSYKKSLTINVIHGCRLIPIARTLLEGRDTNEFLLNIIIDADLIGISHAGDFPRLNIHLKYIQKIYGESGVRPYVPCQDAHV